MSTVYHRYDPTCIGDSPGTWETLEFKDWIDNAKEIVENLGNDKQNILIGKTFHLFEICQ